MVTDPSDKAGEPCAAAEATAVLRADPLVKSRLREFIAVDNTTNWWPLTRVYLIILVTFGVAAGYSEWSRAARWPWLWSVPVFLGAMIVMGASQHQLAGAGHEAVHHTLFRNRLLNEWAGDWLCMFPIFSSVHQFRLYHLAHHQHVNDPERDPDFAMLKASGHWLRFPVSKAAFLGKIARQFLIVDLIRYMIARLRFNSIGDHAANLCRQGGQAARTGPVRLAIGLFLFVVASLAFLQGRVPPLVVAAVPLAAWGICATIYRLAPEDWFESSGVRRVVPARDTFTTQTAFFSFLLAGLAYIQTTTSFMALRYFSVLWCVPLVTTFPIFLMLRQLIQHGNGDRGWLTNTRVFRMNPLVRYAVFPFGMDYHLPHHMYASVPHFRLAALHEFLLTRPAYARFCRVVDNYFFPAPGHPRNPTAIEVLGPDYAQAGTDVFIDESVAVHEEWSRPRDTLSEVR